MEDVDAACGAAPRSAGKSPSSSDGGDEYAAAQPKAPPVSATPEVAKKPARRHFADAAAAALEPAQGKGPDADGADGDKTSHEMKFAQRSPAPPPKRSRTSGHPARNNSADDVPKRSASASDEDIKMSASSEASDASDASGSDAGARRRRPSAWGTPVAARRSAEEGDDAAAAAWVPSGGMLTMRMAMAQFQGLVRHRDQLRHLQRTAVKRPTLGRAAACTVMCYALADIARLADAERQRKAARAASLSLKLASRASPGGGAPRAGATNTRTSRAAAAGAAEPRGAPASPPPPSPPPTPLSAALYAEPRIKGFRGSKPRKHVPRPETPPPGWFPLSPPSAAPRTFDASPAPSALFHAEASPLDFASPRLEASPIAFGISPLNFESSPLAFTASPLGVTSSLAFTASPAFASPCAFDAPPLGALFAAEAEAPAESFDDDAPPAVSRLPGPIELQGRSNLDAPPAPRGGWPGPERAAPGDDSPVDSPDADDSADDPATPATVLAIDSTNSIPPKAWQKPFLETDASHQGPGGAL
ncbi:hypothetical protein M885DRAFT_63905 [Pelagophyceae sp. CCMP2097]|nr:hypothetical protein M885DRAFT_63905 [Pelagophyceae sp. CCMP2097]